MFQKLRKVYFSTSHVMLSKVIASYRVFHMYVKPEYCEHWGASLAAAQRASTQNRDVTFLCSMCSVSASQSHRCGQGRTDPLGRRGHLAAGRLTLRGRPRAALRPAEWRAEVCYVAQASPLLISIDLH